jgi:hypothetical protein
LEQTVENPIKIAQEKKVFVLPLGAEWINGPVEIRAGFDSSLRGKSNMVTPPNVPIQLRAERETHSQGDEQ